MIQLKALNLVKPPPYALELCLTRQYSSGLTMLDHDLNSATYILTVKLCPA